MMTIDIDVDAIAEAVAKKIAPQTGNIVWNCPNALVGLKQIAEFSGYSTRSVFNIMASAGAPAPVNFGGTNRRWFVKDIISFFERNKRH